MKPIQILMDEGLLLGLDREAKRLRSDRSKLIRTAVESYLASARREVLEARHRRGYAAHPQAEDMDAWAEIQAWPEK